MARIILVTGGANSGKSKFAEELCLRKCREKLSPFSIENTSIEEASKIDKASNIYESSKKDKAIKIDETSNIDGDSKIDGVSKIYEDNKGFKDIIGLKRIEISRTLYIATARILDEEMEEKKNRHIERRQAYAWDTLEAYKDFDIHFKEKSILDKGYKVILFDCLTMMVTNIIFESDMDFDSRDKKLRDEKESLVFKHIDILLDLVGGQDLDLVFVTNELGMGLIGDRGLSRYFTYLASKLNSYIAEKSQEMYFIVSGQSIKVK